MAHHNRHGFGLEQVDDATAALIVRLQREDVEELRQLDKGKSREGEKSDAYVAMELYQEELQQADAILADRCMSRSLAQAAISVSGLITDAVAREDMVANDMLLARRVSDGEEVSSNTQGCSATPDLSDLLIARLKTLYVSDSQRINSSQKRLTWQQRRPSRHAGLLQEDFHWRRLVLHASHATNRSVHLKHSKRLVDITTVRSAYRSFSSLPRRTRRCSHRGAAGKRFL